MVRLLDGSIVRLFDGLPVKLATRGRYFRLTKVGNFADCNGWRSCSSKPFGDAIRAGVVQKGIVPKAGDSGAFIAYFRQLEQTPRPKGGELDILMQKTLNWRLKYRNNPKI